MKFINYLTSISGIEIFPMISFLIFFLFFVVLIVWALKVNKDYINSVKEIPLDKNDQQLPTPNK